MEPKRILIVDDDPDLVLASRLVLESAGYLVFEAVDGKSCLEKMRENLPNLVLMDVMMANPLDGYYTTQQIADDPDLRQVPIVMISSIATSQYAEAFPTNQFLDIREFISKPVDPEDLLKTVKRYAK
jgi:CheY-like chemotaxis protein